MDIEKEFKGYAVFKFENENWKRQSRWFNRYELAVDYLNDTESRHRLEIFAEADDVLYFVMNMQKIK